MSAAAPLNLGELPSCSICLEALVRPVTAPCGHSFCLQHVKDWIVEQRKRGVAEPVCTFRCLLPLPNLEDLCVNRALEAHAVALVAAHRAAAASPIALGQALNALLDIFVGWVDASWARLKRLGALLVVFLCSV